MEEDYEPYGPEWEKQLMKYPKSFLIDLYRRSCLKNQQHEDVGKQIISIAESYEMCFSKKDTKQKKRVQSVISNAKKLMGIVQEPVFTHPDETDD